MKKILEIHHNDQVDNKRLGRITPGGQCGYTSACMVLSTVIEEAKSDQFVERFITMMDVDFINAVSNRRNGAILTNYEGILNKLLKDYIVAKRAKVMPYGATNEDVIRAIDKGSPVMAATMLTKDGHFLVIVGYDTERKVWIVNDPYGQFSFADSKYIKIGKGSGKNVEYPYSLLGAAMIRSSRVATGKTGYRILWLE